MFDDDDSGGVGVIEVAGRAGEGEGSGSGLSAGGFGGRSLEARRTRSGGMVRRPFLQTYLAMPAAKMAG